MANKKILIDETQETSQEFLEASTMFLRGKLNDLQKRLKKAEDNLTIAEATANYNKKKLDSWKNKYYNLINKNKKND
tara:strand:+ start:1500 stop:1730 length:231 start_codon:yes stop_codon:yes gene_type:complete